MTMADRRRKYQAAHAQLGAGTRYLSAPSRNAGAHRARAHRPGLRQRFRAMFVARSW